MTDRELLAYQHDRLTLADHVRSALYLARSRADGLVEDQARALLARLAEDRLRLAVAGQFSRGKTTLMNAILGGDFLPTGALPMTSVVTTVTYGSRARASVRRRDATLPIEVPLTELADYVARSGTQRSILQVLSAAVELPSDLLRLGIAFVDTPGIGSEDATSTATTRQYLPEADAAVFVTGFDSPLSSTELAFLTELRQRVGRLFIVINKRDLASPDQLADVEEYVSARLAEQGLADQPVHSVSALQALNARMKGDPEELAASGLTGLENELLGFLTQEKYELLLARAVQRSELLAAALARDLQLGELGTDPRVAKTITDQIDADVARLRSDLEQSITELSDVFDREMMRLVRSHSSSWKADLRSRLTAPMQDLLDRTGSRSPTVESGPQASNADRISESLERSTQPIYQIWWDRHVADVRETLTNSGAEPIGKLLGVDRAVDTITRRAAGLGADQIPAGATWSVGDLPSFSIASAPWTTPVHLGRRARRRGPSAGDLQAALTTTVETAATDATTALCERLGSAVPRWVEHFADVTDHDLNTAINRTLHQLATAPSAADRESLSDLRAALAGFQPGSSDDAADHNDRRSLHADVRTAHSHDQATGPLTCVICARLQRTLTRTLGHEQFRLATMERAQLSHARQSGFCRLHTWEYAAMGSPVGISSGYARLAGDLAEALRTAVDASAGAERPDVDRGAARQLGEVIDRHLQRTDSCRICAELDRTERKQAERLARQPAAPSPAERMPVLCLRHLATVLAAGPDDERARALTRATASRLSRACDDMRSFALAREAIRRNLVTAEENKAYEDALRLLAGLPALARPWSHTED